MSWTHSDGRYEPRHAVASLLVRLVRHSQKGQSMSGITAEDASTLLYLSSLWEGVFRVSLTDHIWSAVSVETGEILTALSASGLREQMREYCWRSRR